ncbi:polymorphic toxin type 44 domain-containing protein [Solidesulfovibrio carbinolicus]|nr:polymorphic toxin type 44 domain-containing protein [Solidesulfovibrio carbinolicus]
MGNSDYGTPEQRLRWEQMEAETTLEIASFYAIQNKLTQIANGTYFQAPETKQSSTFRAPIISIPQSPPGTAIDMNIRQAQESLNPFWFIEMVRPRGPWDFKTQTLNYEGFGNFNYGATALAFGIPEKVALRAAGIVHVFTNKSKKMFENGEIINGISEFKVSFQGPPYGDSQKDQDMIKNGFRYYKEVYLNRFGDGTHEQKDFLLNMYKKVIVDKHPALGFYARHLIEQIDP